MNISINTYQNHIKATGGAITGAVDNTAMAGGEKLEEASLHGGVTVSEGVADAMDISAASIPESALGRDDDIGRLVGRAFGLPPPPMPDFE